METNLKFNNDTLEIDFTPNVKDYLGYFKFIVYG